MADNEDETSAQIVASIDDLLIQIFIHLPLKPLTRFKLISKNWNSLISNPKLYDLRNHVPDPAIGLIFQTPSEIWYDYKPSNAHVVSLDKSSTSPPFTMMKFTNPWQRGVSNINSCNGLLLFRGIESICNQYHSRYYVCNPTTNKYSALPEGIIPTQHKVLAMYLAFDPSKSPHYKVVCVMRLGWNWINRGYPHEIEVYSSETGCWRKCGEPFTDNVNFEDGVYWNGSIHWISSTETGESIYFNPDHDQMPRVMPTPPNLIDTRLRRNYYFGESCGHLHYIDDYKMVKKFSVYEMQRDYSEWFVKYKVDLSYFVKDLFSIYTLVRGKKDEDSFLVLLINRKFIRYNLLHRTSETICEFDGAKFKRHISSMGVKFPLQYIASLCSV